MGKGKVLQKDEYEKGSFSDFEKARETLEDLEVVWRGKVYTFKYKTIGWGRLGQIVTEVVRSLPASVSATEYERARQDRVIREMVVSCQETPMNEARWITLPAEIGEYLRVAFFGNTGEIKQRLESKGLDPDLVKRLMKEMGMTDEAGNVIEGVAAREGEQLKK